MRDYVYGVGWSETDYKDRRRSKRVPVLRPVTYRDEKFGETSSMILDLCVDGAYIESPVVPVDSLIEIEFALIHNRLIKARAVVRYIQLGRGMGVEFLDITAENRDHIQLFVQNF